MSWLYESPSHDPWYNLAVEEYLLSQAKDRVILYLWQNAHTVVVGKNQNPWKECRTTLLEQEGGRLARRLSGGGAVYHDLGNLNFTFLMPQDWFDETKQFSVILEALRKLDIQAEFSGRNDLLAGGRKFSGSAYYKNGTAAYHHGTLLVNADLEKLGRYLTPGKAKLRSKGVDSVASRVCNLSELNPAVTVDTLKDALREAYRFLYKDWKTMTLTEGDRQAVDALAARNRSWEWNYGRKLPFSLELEDRFPWGGVQIGLEVSAGRVERVKVYTDAMDHTLPEKLERAWTGRRFTPEDLSAGLEGLDQATAENLRSLLHRADL